VRVSACFCVFVSLRQAHMHTYTRTRAHTHARARTHTHTHRQTHARQRHLNTGGTEANLSLKHEPIMSRIWHLCAFIRGSMSPIWPLHAPIWPLHALVWHLHALMWHLHALVWHLHANLHNVALYAPYVSLIPPDKRTLTRARERRAKLCVTVMRRRSSVYVPSSTRASIGVIPVTYKDVHGTHERHMRDMNHI